MTDKKTIDNLIKESGNEFHFKVVEHLRNKKDEKGNLEWKVLVSPYYLDFATNKSREADIIAEKIFRTISEKQKKIFIARLFVECKHIEKETVFWFDYADDYGTEKRIENDIGLNLPDTKHHHYFDNYIKEEKVAKLFFSGKTEQENEPFYKGINQCLNSLVYYERAFPPKHSAFLATRKMDVPMLNIMNYPIIVLDGFDKLYRADNKSNIKDSFQLEINYAHENSVSSVNELFVIDVVKLNGLDKLLKRIDTEISKLIPIIVKRFSKS